MQTYLSEMKLIDLESGRIRYIDQGQGESIVLLHGAPVTALGFSRVIDELKSHYRVIAPDLPGFGQSIASANFSGKLQDYSAMVVDFCQRLDLTNVVLYLNDSSGVIGLGAAVQLRSRVKGLVVASTVKLPIPGFVRFVLASVVGGSAFRFLNRKFNLLARLVASVAPYATFEFQKRPFTPMERALLIAQFDTESKRDKITDVFTQMATQQHYLSQLDESTKSQLRDVPTLLLYGQFDAMRLIGSVTAFQETFRKSTTSIIRGEEHFPILGAGRQVAIEIRNWMINTYGN